MVLGLSGGRGKSRPLDRNVTNPTVSFPVILEPRQEAVIEFTSGPGRSPEGWQCTFAGGFIAITDRGLSCGGGSGRAWFRVQQLYDLEDWSAHSCLLLGEVTCNRGGAEPRNVRLPIFLKGGNRNAMRLVTVVDPNIDSVCMFPFQTLEVVFTEKYGIHPEVHGGPDALERVGCGSFIHTNTQVRRLVSPMCDRRQCGLRTNGWLSADSPYYPVRKDYPLISNVEHHFFQPARQPAAKSSPRNGVPSCEIKFYTREGGHVEDLEGILEVRYIIDGSGWDGTDGLRETRDRIDRAILQLGSPPHFDQPARHVRADPGTSASTPDGVQWGHGSVPFTSVTEAIDADRRREDAVRAWLVEGSRATRQWRSSVTDPVHEDFEFEEGQDNTFVVELTHPKDLKPDADPGWTAESHPASYLRRGNPFTIEVVFIDRRSDPAGDTWRYMVAVSRHQSVRYEATYIGTVRFLAENAGGLQRTVNLWFRDEACSRRPRPDETDWRNHQHSRARVNWHTKIRITEDTSPGLEVASQPLSITYGTLLSMQAEKPGKGKRKKGGGGVRVSDR